MLHDLATFNPSRTAAETREAEARADEARARARIAQQEAAVRYQQARAQRAAEAEKRAELQFEARLKLARLFHPDLDEVIARPEFKPTPAMQEAMFRSPAGPEVAYWLAKHPEESERIAAEPPRKAKGEIHKIEQKLNREK